MDFPWQMRDVATKLFAHHVCPGLYWSRKLRIHNILQLKSRSSLRKSTNTGNIDHVIMLHNSTIIFSYVNSPSAYSQLQRVDFKSHRSLFLKSEQNQE